MLAAAWDGLNAAKRMVACAPTSKVIFGPLIPQQNPHFTGRESALADLREQLISGRIGAWKQAITGMGGVGKTQLAVEYVYLYRNEYVVMWWMRAEEPVTLASDYEGLADVIGEKALGLSEDRMADHDAKIQAIQRWLDNESNWLLVFDNAKEPENIAPYIPHQGGGHVLITSRTRDWNGVAESDRELGVFDRDDAVKFIIERTGQSDENAAEVLANELGCLPLALEQAGSYIKTRYKSIDEYLTLFRERHEALLQRERPANYPDTVATTWEISFQQAERDTKSAADFAALCAYVAPDNIPRWLFSNVPSSLAEELPLLADDVEFEDAMAALQNYSLITVTEDAISIHRLMQMIVRDRLGEDGERKWVEMAVQLLNGAFPSDTDDRTTWPSYAALMSHVLQVKEHAERLGIASETVAVLLSNAGNYLRVQADFSTARLFHEQALKIMKVVYGDNHPNVAGALNNLGLVLAELGDYPNAKDYHEQALKIRKAIYGDKHPQVAMSLNNLGLVLAELGDYPNAKECFEQALGIYKAIYGDKHPDVASALFSLGTVLELSGDYPNAKDYHEQALKIRKAIYGDKHPQVAMSLNNLGLVLVDLGDYPKAKECFEQALKIRRVVYGDKHPYVATSLNNLGVILVKLGDSIQAKDCQEQASEIYKAIYGDKHPKTIRALNTLKNLHSKSP